MDEVYDYLRTKNTGLCQMTGKIFWELMKEFLIGLDNMYLIKECFFTILCFEAQSQGVLMELFSAAHRGQFKILNDGDT